MFNRKSLFAVVLSVSLFAFINPAISKQKTKRYEKSAFSNFASLPVNEAAGAATTKIVNAKFPGWVVNTDKLNGSFTDIYGVPVAQAGSTNIERAQACVSDKLSDLGILKSEWKQVSNIDAPKGGYVYYSQMINGHAVVFSRLSFRFSKAGDLARIQMKYYGEPSKFKTPVLTKSAAKQAALKDLDGIIISGAEITGDWSWFPVPAAGGYSLHPAWPFKVVSKVQGSVPLILTGYVDGLDGTILYRSNQVKETGYDVTVKGVVYKNGTLNPTSSEALPDLGLKIDTGTYYTDTAGVYADTSMLLPISTTIPLAGRWSTVIDSITGLTPIFTDTVLIPGTTFTYPTAAPCSDRHVNAYYHVNRVHNFMKGYFPTFTGMDFSLPTNVDLTSGTCNAFYSGTDINFYAADATCHSFAEIGDVIYHEYGHGISDHFYTMVSGTTITNGALNEASSDIWALSITRHPILAENAFVGYGGFIRRYDMTPQVYPIDLNTTPLIADPHQNGQIIAGSWWDVAVEIGSVDTMTRLFTDVYYDAPDGPDGTEGVVYQTILIDALMADDDNSNLMDGTPHYAQIVAAFAKHGIYLEKDATITHTELSNQPQGTPIPVSAHLTLGSSTYFHDLTMYYRINGTGVWTPVVLTNSSMNFTGAIPAQDYGTTVEYYFVVHDALSVPNAYFPITCNPSMVSSQVTIPYQFGVGIGAVDSNNFEGAVAGWGISGNPGDDATDGLWHQGVPTPATIYYTAWPAHDHTTGSGQCLVTGAGAFFSGTGVTGGTSTVLTPVFDISGFTNPIVEYYRWFSNDQGANFKNDPWIVKINNGAGGAWQTVEHTYQSDVAWRRRIFPVSTYLPGATHVQLQFFASDSLLTNWDSNGQSTTAGSIDDFFIYDKRDLSGVAVVSALKSNIYPNPADETVNIVLSQDVPGTISCYDVLGQKVEELTIASGKTNYTISTKDLSPGTYSLVIQTGGSIQSKKIVVAHK